MFNSNNEFITHVLDYQGIPYEEPFDQVEYNQRVFIPLFKEALLECQKLVDFSNMRSSSFYTLQQGTNYVTLGTNIKYIHSVIDNETGDLIQFGSPYANEASQYQQGKPQFYYFADNEGKIYFDKIADREYKFIIIAYKFDLDSDPHFILQEAPELLRACFLAKLMLYLGKTNEWRIFLEQFYSLAKLQEGIEKQKKYIETRFKLNWNYNGWW